MPQHVRGKCGPNDPCWCGSGKKYKKCHRDRNQQPRLDVQAVLEGQKRASRRVTTPCLGADLGSAPCEGRAIKSHSLSRAGSLERIAQDGHVYGFVPSRAAAFPTVKRNGGRLIPGLVGVNQASTFGGFCARHDDQIFRPLDREPLEPTPTQVALIAYRAMAREAFGLRTLGSHTSIMREMDRGRDPLEQLLIQASVDGFADHVEERLPPLEAQMRNLRALLAAGKYEDLNYLQLRFSGPPQILCSAVFRPEIDLSDRYLMNLYDSGADTRLVAYALLPRGQETIALFAWLGTFPEAEAFAQSVAEVSPQRLPTVLTRFMFEMFDNVWMAPSWWEGLHESERAFLIDRMSKAGLPQPITEWDRGQPSFVDPGMTFAEWELKSTSRHGALSSPSAPLSGPDVAGPWRDMFARLDKRMGGDSAKNRL